MKQEEIDTVNEPIVEYEDIGSNTLMEEPFNPKLIDIKQKNLSIDLIRKRLEANPKEIDLYPDFQRKDDLWDSIRQSQLIESILINFPLPAFYFDGTENNKWLIVDGLQRLSTIRNFIIDKKLTLTGLEFLKQLEGKKFEELPRTLQRQIEETQIVAYIINPGTPLKVKFNIFKRINTGGLVLTSQEIRHALNQPIPAKFVALLANSKEFKEATHFKINTERMLDREFVTRFITFYTKPITDYSPDLDSYMNDRMSDIKLLNDKQRKKLEEEFLESMKLAKSVFGRWAFRKVFTDSYSERLKPINKALFEVWSVEFAKLNELQRNKVKASSKLLFKEFIKLMNSDDRFIDSITSSTGDRTRVIYRFKTIENLIQKLITS